MIRQLCFVVFSFGSIVATVASAAASEFNIPVEYHKLSNGLRVVISEDHSVPVVTVAVYYNIGFRIEPKGRTGFAHLFEHMMFQGSKNLGKMEFIKLVQQNGGVLNGSTRFDLTNYFEILPSNQLEVALWAEADRMSGLNINEENLKNQRDVVKNEVRVNVMNRPYGGFPWLDMPQKANKNWHNAHNFYGDFTDLDSASLKDVQSFFQSYYAPNNAVVTVVGDVNPKETLELVKKYFEKIASHPLPAKSDISEPPQTQEQFFTKEDKLAPNPAIAVAYHMPERNTAEYYAMGVIAQILTGGESSRLYQKLVKEKQVTDNVIGGINLLGGMFTYNGPMEYTFSAFYKPSFTAKDILQPIDEVIDQLQSTTVSADELKRVLARWKSNFYSSLSQGFGKADLLSALALFDEDPSRINTLLQKMEQVSPELIQQTAQKYLIKANRTIIDLQPGARKPPQQK